MKQQQPNGLSQRSTSARHAHAVTSDAGAMHWMKRHKTALGVVGMMAITLSVTPLGLLLWARLRILTNIPKTAIADDPASVVASAKPPVDLETGLSIGSPLLIDPFTIDPRTYPNAHSSTPSIASIVPTQKTNGGSAEVLVLAEVETARRASERFRLQTAGRGLSIAVIDGRTYRVGDALFSADGFRFVLVEVLEGGAVLECGAERYEIRMRAAGAGVAPNEQAERR